MDIIRLTYPFEKGEFEHAASPQILGIGIFDGVHKGHQELIAQTVKMARDRAMAASILTFDPHPREVLKHVRKAQHLTPLADKCELFGRLGIERIYVISFNLPFSKLTPEQFIDRVIVPLCTDTVVVGFNFTFGHLGRGTAETFREAARGRYKVSVVRPFDIEGERVSSTLIRESMSAGNMARVSQLLGRSYKIAGTVIHGEGRGRTIGVPTANLGLNEAYALPCAGVYAVMTKVKGMERPGVMNIGVKPTFHDEQRQVSLEVHLFDFDQDIYGETMEVYFIAFIRQEMKFASVDALVEQIGRDVRQARERMEPAIYFDPDNVIY